MLNAPLQSDALRSDYKHCSGECGAVEEHVMEYDDTDIAILEVRTGDIFRIAGHHPLLAGYTADGEPLYMSEYFFRDVPVPENAQPENVKIKEHYLDGSTAIEARSHFSVSMLRYDPESYDLCEHYSSRKKEEIGMDATGPFSWKFHRMLPDSKPGEVWPHGPLWCEVLTEPIEAEYPRDVETLVITGVEVENSEEFTNTEMTDSEQGVV